MSKFLGTTAVAAVMLVATLGAASAAKAPKGDKTCFTVKDIKQEMKKDGLDQSGIDAFKPLSPSDFALFTGFFAAAGKPLPDSVKTIYAGVFSDRPVIVAGLDSKGCSEGIIVIPLEIWAKIFGGDSAPAPKPETKSPVPHDGAAAGKGDESDSI